jgi:hypothetical protein
VATDKRPSGAAAREKAEERPRMFRRTCLVDLSPIRRMRGPTPESVLLHSSVDGSTYPIDWMIRGWCLRGTLSIRGRRERIESRTAMSAKRGPGMVLRISRLEIPFSKYSE